MDKYEKLFGECLVEMFHRVGLDVKDHDEALAWAKEHGAQWFIDKRWTREEQDAFQTWMTTLIRKKLRMRKDRAEFEAAMFTMNYGWKTEEKQC